MKLLILCSLVAGVTCMTALAEFRTLVSDNGKAMKAELVSHAGGKVTIRREDGKEFEVTPGIFCKQDEEAILAWMKANPAKIDYRLTAGAAKKVAGSTEYSTSLYCEITLRNDGQEAIKGIKIMYRVITESYGSERMKEGEYLLEQDLQFNRTLALKSEVFSRSKSDRNSGMKGCLIRVLDPKGEVVLDWVSNEAGMKDVTWESTNPKAPGEAGQKVEIR